MRLNEIMSSPVEAIASDVPVAQARERMRRARIHHLVVMDGGKVAGVMSERNLHDSPPHVPVASAMNRQIVTASPATTVRAAANLMRGTGVGCLPVFERERLVGIVTVTDLLVLLGRGAERPVPTSRRWTLRRRGPRTKLVSDVRRGREGP